MRLGSALLGACFFLGTNVASAALTSSEKGQIKDFVAGARVHNAHKVRALVARADLTAEESIAALTGAVLPVVFNEPRGNFLKELAFGGASGASRPTIVLAAVKALIARADTIYQRYGTGLENESSAILELVAIYGWVDATIANAGKPTSTAHDDGAGIPAATYDDCSKVLRDHVERQARWLKGGGTVPDTIGRLRAQAQMTLIDMMPDGLTRWVDAADRLALSGARRAMLLNWGVLFADAGKLDEPRLERVRQILARLSGARVDLGLIYAGDDRGGPLRARGLVAYVAPGASPYPFSDEVAPGTYDPATSAVAHDLAVIAAKRALDSRGELRLQAERDAAAASGDMGRLLGRPRAPSVEHVMGAAIHALLMDAPRAVDLSFARLLGSRPETAALLSDAIGALAVSAIEDKDAKGKGTTFDLGGKGSTGWTPASAIHLAPNGAALGFTLDGHAWTIDRSAPSYVVLGVRRDGQPVSGAQLSSKGIPRNGAEWSEAGYTFKKVRGMPRVAVSVGQRSGSMNLKLLGTSADGFDAISVVPPGSDFTIEGELAVRDAPGGIGFRTRATKKGLRGASLVITPKGHTVLSVIEDSGETNLGVPIEPSPIGAVPVKITVKGVKVEAVVGKTTLNGTLPESLESGDVVILGKRNAIVDIVGFSMKQK